MGEVWKARDSETGSLVAAKVLRPELFGEESSLSRLRVEARNAMRIQHPNIAAVLDSGEDQGRGWIVMELVEGRPLTDYLRGQARIPVADLLPVLVQVAMALGAAQSAGVVHRDIKPANILVRPDGRVKLTDFGISRTASQAPMTAAGMVMGTAQYLAPEQAMGETATSSGDLYALGVIAYEAVAGVRPFTGATQVDIAFSHVNDQVPPLPADVPAPFANVVLHLLEKSPAHRPESGTALVRELVACAHALDIGFTPRPLPEPAGEVASPSTASHPVIAPVEHTPRRTLPEELLAPVHVDEGVPTSAGAGVEWGERRPAHAADSGVGSAGPTGEGSGGPADPRARVREELASRLRRRAAIRDEEDSRAPSGAASSAPPAASAAPGATRARHRLVAGNEAAPSSLGDAPTRAESSVREPPVPSRAPQESRSVRRTSVRSRSRRATSLPGALPWHGVTAGAAPRVGPERARPTRTRYNRSVVAPPVPLKDRIGMWVVIVLIVVTVVLIAVATVHNRFGSLTSVLGSGVHMIEEVRTWSTPWPTV